MESISGEQISPYSLTDGQSYALPETHRSERHLSEDVWRNIQEVAHSYVIEKQTQTMIFGPLTRVQYIL